MVIPLCELKSRAFELPPPYEAPLYLLVGGEEEGRQAMDVMTQGGCVHWLYDWSIQSYMYRTCVFTDRSGTGCAGYVWHESRISTFLLTSSPLPPFPFPASPSLQVVMQHPCPPRPSPSLPYPSAPSSLPHPLPGPPPLAPLNGPL